MANHCSHEVFIALCRGDFEAAIVLAKNGLELHPYLHLGRTYYAQALEYAGRVEDALTQYRLTRLIAPTSVGARLGGCCLARTAGSKKPRILPRKWWQCVSRTMWMPTSALLLDALGYRDDAMAELERAVEENSATLYMLDVDPKLEPLRADRRFQPLRNKCSAWKCQFGPLGERSSGRTL